VFHYYLIRESALIFQYRLFASSKQETVVRYLQTRLFLVFNFVCFFQFNLRSSSLVLRRKHQLIFYQNPRCQEFILALSGAGAEDHSRQDK